MTAAPAPWAVDSVKMEGLPMTRRRARQPWFLAAMVAFPVLAAARGEDGRLVCAPCELADPACVGSHSLASASADSADLVCTRKATGKSGILNVFDFGARGDGVTDDSAAIQSGIDAAQATQGRLFFPPGRFLVRQGLRITSAVTLQGASAAGDSEAHVGSQIVTDRPIAVLTIDCPRADGPTISELRISGSSVSLGAIWIRHGLGTRLTNVRISRFSEGYGVQIGDVDSDVFWTYIDEIKVDKCLYGIATVPNSHYVGNTIVRGGSLDGTGRRGIGVSLRIANGDFNRFRDLSIEGFGVGMLLSASDTDVSAYFEGMPVAIDVRGRRNHIHHSLFIANGVGVTLANAAKPGDVEGTSIKDNGWKNVPRGGSYVVEHAEGDPTVALAEHYLDTTGPAGFARSVLPRLDLRAPAGQDGLVMRDGARVRFGASPGAYVASNENGIATGGALTVGPGGASEIRAAGVTSPGDRPLRISGVGSDSSGRFAVEVGSERPLSAPSSGVVAFYAGEGSAPKGALYASGGWSVSGGVSPGGTDGQMQAGQLFMGAGPPAATAGAVGDFYLRTDSPETANQRLYVKTGPGRWVGIL